MFHPLQRHRPNRAFVALLAFALWMSGLLGALHEAVHVPGLAAAAASVDRGAHGHHEAHGNGAHGHGAHDHAVHGWASLFGAHTDAECRLYDQLAHGAGAPTVPVVVLPVLWPSAVFASLQGAAIARWIALFDARGPPSTR